MKRLRRLKRWQLIGLILIILGVAVMAISSYKPAKKPVVAASYETPQARDALRKAHLTQLATALNQYVLDNSGKKLPAAIPVADTEICRVISTSCKTAHLIDLTFLVNPSNLIRSIPVDPTGGHDRYGSGYTIGRDQVSGKFRFSAPRTEDAAVIVVEE